MEFTYLEKKMIITLSCNSRQDTLLTLSRLLPYITDMETRAIAYGALHALSAITDQDYTRIFNSAKSA